MFKIIFLNGLSEHVYLYFIHIKILRVVLSLHNTEEKYINRKESPEVRRGYCSLEGGVCSDRKEANWLFAAQTQLYCLAVPLLELKLRLYFCSTRLPSEYIQIIVSSAHYLDNWNLWYVNVSCTGEAESVLSQFMPV